MPNLLEFGFNGLARASWQAAVLGAFVLVVCTALGYRLAPRWRFSLWLLVTVRLALPVAPVCPWSIFGLVEPARWTGTESGPFPITGQAAGDAYWVSPRRVQPADKRSTATEYPESSGNAPDAPPDRPASATLRWWMVVWLIGLILLTTRHVRMNIDIRRRRRTWREASGMAQELFDRCRSEAGVGGSVRLMIAPDVFGPATLSPLRPCVVVPESLLAHLSPDELRYVFLHELAHVRRRDVLVDRLASTLTGLHWFNPVAWLALAGLRREREHACDEWVLQLLGRRAARSYGHTLLTVVRYLAGHPTPASVVGVFGQNRPLERRFAMIVRFRPPTVARKLLGLTLLFAMAVAGLTDAAPAPSSARDKDMKPITVSGACRDQDGKPVPGVKIALYREDFWARKAERLQVQTTDEKGGFAFRDLPKPPEDNGRPNWNYALVVTKAGHGSMTRGLFGKFLTEPIEFRIHSAATLQGQVTDSSGKPVAGARVWALGLAGGPLDDVGSARTDADGHYEIRDMCAWGPDATEPKPLGNGLSTRLIECYFNILHPAFAHERPAYRGMPATVNVVLRPAGVLEGKVVDRATRKPGAGVRVFLQGTGKTRLGGSAPVSTDAEGKYRIPSLVAGSYNVLVDAPDRVCAALDSITVEAGKTLGAPDLVLEEGGWIEGRLLNGADGKPLSGRTADGRLTVGLYGPSRPKSGAACAYCSVDDEGRFRIRAAPGVNYPYIMRSDYWKRTDGKQDFEKGVEVKAGQIVAVEFKVLPP